MSQDDVIALVLEETRGNLEQAMDILLGMAGDDADQGNCCLLLSSGSVVWSF